MQPKIQLKAQYIDIFEEIDSPNILNILDIHNLFTYKLLAHLMFLIFLITIYLQVVGPLGQRPWDGGLREGRGRHL